MTPQETARKQAEVMVAFAEGKKIQAIKVRDGAVDWVCAYDAIIEVKELR